LHGISHPLVAHHVCVGLYVQLSGTVDVVIVRLVLVLELEDVDVVLGLSGVYPFTPLWSTMAEADLALLAWTTYPVLIKILHTLSSDTEL
jgi:hypothetical protein